MKSNKLFLFSGLLGCTLPALTASGQNVAPKPNIIYILADDLGYGDIDILGQKIIKTPNIDRLAREGMIFTNHYAGSAVSGPSRCVLLTGKHTGHSTIRGNKSIPGVGVIPLSNKDITLPEAIKKNADYTTAMTGRWHLGGELTKQTPFHRGFDYHFGKLSSDYPNKHGVLIDSLWDANGQHIQYKDYSARNLEPMYENGKLYNLSPEENAHDRPINMDRLVTDKALKFIDNHQKTPFFLYVAYALVHAPMEFQKDTPVEKNNWPETERDFASMLMSLDIYVGEIMAEVDKQGLGKNTLIIFTSDNGAHNEGGHSYKFFDSTGKFRGYKRDFYDGGFHTPMFARWTGTIKPGSTTNLLSAFWDVMPTVCELAGAPIPQQTDGISFAPTLLGQEQKNTHKYLYWEFNERSNFETNPTPQYKQAVVFGKWKVIKYIDTNIIEAYDLSKDIGEQNNLAKSHPEVVKQALDFMKEAHQPNWIFPILRDERLNQ